MSAPINPAAVDPIPAFIVAPGESDVLMVGVAIFLIVSVVAFGVLYFRLHSLPEHIAHKSKKVQLELVAVLGLISLFTHMHIFWIIGLILAFVDFPDFGGILSRIAAAIEALRQGSASDTASVQPDDKNTPVAAGSEPSQAMKAPQSPVRTLEDAGHV